MKSLTEGKNKNSQSKPAPTRDRKTVAPPPPALPAQRKVKQDKSKKQEIKRRQPVKNKHVIKKRIAQHIEAQGLEPLYDSHIIDPKKKEILLEQLEIQQGNVTLACLAARVNRRAYYRWREASAQFAMEADAAIAAGEDRELDMAEAKLNAAISKNSLTAVMFKLNNKGRRRGYGKQVIEHTGKDGERNIPFSFETILNVNINNQLPDADTDK